MMQMVFTVLIFNYVPVTSIKVKTKYLQKTIKLGHKYKMVNVISFISFKIFPIHFMYINIFFITNRVQKLFVLSLNS